MFRPVLFSDLKHYNFQTFRADLFAGLTVGVVALPLAMAFAIAWRTAAGTRALYRHRGGIPDLALRRLPGSDRRADGGIHHHHRVDRRAARARGTGGQHAAGGSIPDPARVIPHGRTHQIRAVPGRDRLHLRHRGRDLLDPAQGDPRAQGRSAGGIPGKAQILRRTPVGNQPSRAPALSRYDGGHPRLPQTVPAPSRHADRNARGNRRRRHFPPRRRNDRHEVRRTAAGAPFPFPAGFPLE